MTYEELMNTFSTEQGYSIYDAGSLEGTFQYEEGGPTYYGSGVDDPSALNVQGWINAAIEDGWWETPTVTPSESAVLGLEFQDYDERQFIENTGSITLSDMLYDMSGGKLGYLDIMSGGYNPGDQETIDMLTGSGMGIGLTEEQIIEYGNLTPESYEALSEEELAALGYEAYGLDLGGLTAMSAHTGHQSQIGYGRQDSYFSDHLDKYFQFDPLTGRFVPKYDAGIMESEERESFEAGRGELRTNLQEYSLAHGEEEGKSLSGEALSLDDIKRFSSRQIDQMSAKLESDIGISRRTYYDDMTASVYDMLSEMDLPGVTQSYEERYPG